ncbi:MAG: hypothetical protein Q4A43_05405 [Coriobacteriia bacterium]|nr:hypothetical protein [Coriobacteriia bacterium]
MKHIKKAGFFDAGSKSYRLLSILFFLFVLSVCAALIFYDFTSFFYKRNLAMPCLALLVISLVSLGAAISLFSSRLNSKMFGEGKRVDICVYVISAVLLIAHLLIAYQTRFLGSWDNGGLYTAAWNAVHGWSGIPFAPEGWNEYFTKELFNQYFSNYPNNTFLVALMMGVMCILKSIGIGGFSVPLLVFTCLNSVLCVVSGVLLYSILKSRCSHAISFFGFIAFVVLIGFSPWFLVAYSDSLVIAIPIFICWIVTKMEGQPLSRVCPKMGVMVFVGLVGYFIKPQVIFILAAVLLVYVFPRVAAALKSACVSECLLIVASLLVGAAIAFLVKGVAGYVVSDSFEIDDSQSFSATHFFMMGLNDVSNGGFCAEDVFFSQSYSNKVERNAADLYRALERVSEKGADGVVLHGLKKQLTLWGDSSFGWNQEGGIAGTYTIMLKNSPSPFSLYLMADLETEGQVIDTPYGAVVQIVWFMIVLSLFASVKIGRDCRFVAVLMISILCLGVFELCFEARSRYLFAYVPVVILLACLALDSIRNRCGLMVKNRQGRHAKNAEACG